MLGAVHINCQSVECYPDSALAERYRNVDDDMCTLIMRVHRTLRYFSAIHSVSLTSTIGLNAPPRCYHINNETWTGRSHFVSSH